MIRGVRQDWRRYRKEVDIEGGIEEKKVAAYIKGDGTKVLLYQFTCLHVFSN